MSPTVHVLQLFFAGAIVPIMRDPHQLLDYENWWKKELNNIRPYVVPPATVDLISKMEVQLEDSSNRIGNTRTNGEQIVQHLQGLINELKVEQTFPFTWNLKIYRAPPKKAVTKFEFTPEQLAIIENVHLDNAIKRTYNLDPCMIVNQVSRIETSHFCVIKCSKDTNTPFYVAEVVSNNLDQNTLTVQWWAPNAIAKQKGGKYHTMAFEGCTTKHRVQNRQRGAPQWRLKPHLDTIQYNTVYFGFSKLTRDRRLPAEVQRKLRALSLISKNLKIKRL